VKEHQGTSFCRTDYRNVEKPELISSLYYGTSPECSVLNWC